MDMVVDKGRYACSVRLNVKQRQPEDGNGDAA
jgi:hypothetical protein